MIERGAASPRGSHPAMPNHQWVFRAAPVRVVDADTIQVVLDGGFHNHQQERLRLLGLDAPEVVGANRAAGLAAAAWVKAWLDESWDSGDRDGWPLTWPLVVQTVKADVFGRYLVTVWRVNDGRCLNADLLAAGHAVEDIRP